MNVLFLDFDGVINTPVGIDEKGNLIDRYYGTFDKKVNNFVAVKLIERLCRECDLKIVVQSRGWRNYIERNPDGSVRYRPYKEYLENSGMDSSLVEGHVPYIYNKGKGDEIDEYLRENQVDKFIVIDDNDNGNGNVGDLTLLRFKDELIVCDGDRGFTEREYKKALEILAKDRTYILKGKCQDDLEIEI